MRPARLAALVAVAALAACQPRPDDDATVSRINREVNAAITYTLDSKQYGKLELWVEDPVSGKGDCEDYALTKRKRLLAAGFDESRLVMWQVLMRDSRLGHAVLIVDEKWVLDNNFSVPKTRAYLESVYTSWKPIDLSRRHYVREAGA